MELLKNDLRSLLPGLKFTDRKSIGLISNIPIGVILGYRCWMSFMNSQM